MPYIKNITRNLLEGARFITTFAAVPIGISYMQSGKVKEGAIAFSVSATLPLSRYIIRNMRKKQILGTYPIPKIPIKTATNS